MAFAHIIDRYMEKEPLVCRELDMKLEYVHILHDWAERATSVEGVLLPYAPPEKGDMFIKHFEDNAHFRNFCMAHIEKTANLCRAATNRVEQQKLGDQLSQLYQEYLGYANGHYVASNVLIPYYKKANQPTVITSIRVHPR